MLIWHAVCIACGLFWPFLFCLYATFAIQRIHDIGEFTYAFEWYNYPLNLQKTMILIIVRSQERIEFNGLNFFHCNMEVFGKVLILFNFHFEFICFFLHFLIEIIFFHRFLKHPALTIVFFEV